ncbi:MAG: DNA translocase FtsK [Atopobiaceae bacterium]|nr:DNA translocase FtsK [Atopobiaceae bacterium]
MPRTRGTGKAKKGEAQARVKAPQLPTLTRGSLQSDIVGVLLAVLAVALLVSLLAPSDAVLTSAVAYGLTWLFGVGAILAPISLMLFSATFFVDGEEPFGLRVAGGLLLVSVAILSLISLFVTGAAENPSLVLEAPQAMSAGGMVGGCVAWVLLSLVGRLVGCVLIIGLVILGVIVCGFSMSAFVARVRAGAVELRHARRAAREELEPALAADVPVSVIASGSYQGNQDEPRDAQTSFIGSRTTTVLTRRRRKLVDPRPDEPTPERTDDDANADAPATPPTLRRKANQATRTRSARSKQAQAEVQNTAIPDFLLNARSVQSPTRQSEAQKRPPKSRRPKKTRTAPTGQTTSPKPKRGTRTSVAPKQSAPKQVTAAPEVTTRPGDGMEGYELPPMSMLSSNPNSAGSASSVEELNETMDRLQGTLHEFGLTSRVVDYISGPIVTTFRVEMGEGERVSRIRNLEDDIALTLAAEKVRIFAPIPGTSFVGIEIPNRTRQNVYLGDVLPTASGGPLEVAIGRDSSGSPVIADIAKMPHMLVAGTTGSGKSVMINSMIMSLLMRTSPKQVRLIMIDPKRVEFSCYNGLPHLYVPVVTEPRQAASALQWAVSEMERRLRVFERAGAREIKVYNQMCVSGKLSEMEHPPEPMPYLVVIIDELSDLMMVAGKDVEASIVRIAQLARAAGIHLVIATQRPSANVVTGLIKSNIDNRVALKVSSGLDSRVILDEAGAERLLGNGDMLFKYRGLNMQRVLGCYTSDEEINEVVDFIRDQAEPDYHEEILTAVVPAQPAGGGRSMDADADDPLVWEAAQIVVESRLGSTSGLQRRLKVGYSRAGRIMDMLEAKGVVGPPDGSKPREVLLDEEGLEELRIQDAKYREVI